MGYFKQQLALLHNWNHKLNHSIILSIFSKFFQIITVFFSIYSSASYLDVSEISLWLTLTGLSGFFLFADFGINNFFANYVSTKKGKFYLDKMSVNVIASLILISVFYFILLFNLKSYALNNLLSAQILNYTQSFNSAYLVFISLSSLSIFTSGLERIIFGTRKMHLLHTWSIWAYSFVLACLQLSNFLHLNLSINALIFLNLIVPITINLILFLRFFNKGVLVSLLDFLLIKSIFSQSLTYLVNSLSYAILISADYFIATKKFGIFGLLGFNLCQRIFQIVIQPLYLMNNQFWSHISHSNVNNKTHYLNTKKFLVTLNALYTGLIIIFLYFFIGKLGLILSNKKYLISGMMYFAFATRAILEIIILYFIVLYGASALKLEKTLPVLFLSIFIFIFKFFMIDFYEFELVIIFSSIFSIIFLLIYFRLFL